MPQTPDTAPKKMLAEELEDLFARYEALTAKVNAVFDTVRQQYPDGVTCAPGCSDCCHAVFDLSLAEAMYLNHKFNQSMAQDRRQAVLERADRAEREHARLARRASKKSRQGAKDEDVLKDMAAERVRCPLLADDDTCELYEFRPLTCRLYGVPQNIGGQARVCGLTGFDPGQSYPAVAVDKIQDALVELSYLVGQRLGSKFSGLAVTHMPLATALMSEFDEDYLGIKPDADEEEERLVDSVRNAGCGCGETGSGENSGQGCGEGCGCGPDKSGGCEGEPTILTFGDSGKSGDK